MANENNALPDLLSKTPNSCPEVLDSGATLLSPWRSTIICCCNVLLLPISHPRNYHALSRFKLGFSSLSRTVSLASHRCLLVRRVAASCLPTLGQHPSISLHFGIKPLDIYLISDTFNEAAAADLVNNVTLARCSEEKARVTTSLLEEGTRRRIRDSVEKNEWLFLSMGTKVASGTGAVLLSLLGSRRVEEMGLFATFFYSHVTRYLFTDRATISFKLWQRSLLRLPFRSLDPRLKRLEKYSLPYPPYPLYL